MKFQAMPQQDIEFLQQFRSGDIDLPQEDRQFGNVCFRHFSRNRKEKGALEEILQDQLAHSAIIDALIGKMEKEDQVVDRQLAAFLQKLQKSLSGLSRKEPSARIRLEKLTAEISAISDRVRLFHLRTQPLLLETLKNISAERKAARNAGYVGSQNVRTMQLLARRYRESLYLYHEVFTGFLEDESEKMGKVMVISALGNCLLNLTILIKARIASIEVSFNCLGEWKMKLRLEEAQGVYN